MYSGGACVFSFAFVLCRKYKFCPHSCILNLNTHISYRDVAQWAHAAWDILVLLHHIAAAEARRLKSHYPSLPSFPPRPSACASTLTRLHTGARTHASTPQPTHLPADRQARPRSCSGWSDLNKPGLRTSDRAEVRACARALKVRACVTIFVCMLDDDTGWRVISWRRKKKSRPDGQSHRFLPPARALFIGLKAAGWLATAGGDSQKDRRILTR